MSAVMDDFFAEIAARKRRKRELDAKRNGCHSTYRVDDPLNLALRDWRVPNPGTTVPNLGMTWRIAG